MSRKLCSCEDTNEIKRELAWRLRGSSYVSLISRVTGAKFITYRASVCEL